MTASLWDDGSVRSLGVLVLVTACYAPAGTRCEPCQGIAECPGGVACIDGYCQEAAGSCTMPSDGARTCYGVNTAPFIQFCDPPLSERRRDLTGDIDTNSACTVVTVIGQVPLCLIAADIITTTNTIRVTGGHPLVLLARESMSIDGVLNLAGSRDDTASTPLAAGANVEACASPKGDTALPGGGGPGGSHRGRGGRGGASAQSGTTDAPLPLEVSTLHGGCRGGDGGPAGGLGGNSGGAIYLLAPKLEILGTINASGGGGRVASTSTGGGGGGSGGMILLWSSGAIGFGNDARVFALGGGGSAGGTGSGPGEPGQDPRSPTEGAIATTQSPGAGGAGGGPSTSDGDPGGAGAATGGGGGGGGAVGEIRLIGPGTVVDGNKVAPAPM